MLRPDTNDPAGSWENTGVKLRWLAQGDGLPYQAYADIAVHAVEMVYVPEGSFYVGGGTAGSSRFFMHDSGPKVTSYVVGTFPCVTNPFPITSEAAFNCGTNNGEFFFVQAGEHMHNSGSAIINAQLPAGFPKGYQAFYSMKYEISQGQYVDFLNEITPTAASNRFHAGTQNANAYNIDTNGGVFTATTPTLACGYLTYVDSSAYADWAGLRPPTELEYEKTCRGPLHANQGGYAWGTASINNLTDAEIVGTIGSGEEVPDASSNCRTSGNVVRCGIFGRASGATRANSGAGYWGNMNLGANVREPTIAAVNYGSKNYVDDHGDGVLSAAGAENESWPNGGTYQGTGCRGGWIGSSAGCTTSYRQLAVRWTVYTGIGSRSQVNGGRSVRTAP